MSGKTYWTIGLTSLVTTFVLAGLAFIPDKDCRTLINESKPLYILLQFLIITVMGTLVKYVLDQGQKAKEERDKIKEKEKDLYEGTLLNYNKAKSVRRRLQVFLKAEVTTEGILSFKEELDEIQLEFERLRDYLLVNEELFKKESELKRSSLLRALHCMEQALNDITKEIREKLNWNGKVLEVECYDKMKIFADESGPKNVFLKSFDDFQNTSFNYNDRKKALEKELKKKGGLVVS